MRFVNANFCEKCVSELSAPQAGRIRTSNATKTEKEAEFMGQKEPNTDIRCRVESCSFHCGDRDYCSLSSIQVEPCQDCHSGKAADESMCGSYRKK